MPFLSTADTILHFPAAQPQRAVSVHNTVDDSIGRDPVKVMLKPRIKSEENVFT